MRNEERSAKSNEVCAKKFQTWMSKKLANEIMKSTKRFGTFENLF